ncbi:hypothetical protein JTB14_012667 [Gonioctena quinquepunctata]|nr:hypothetical protein JTB14_012667 [Gonioctena quinquepunctata]
MGWFSLMNPNSQNSSSTIETEIIQHSNKRSLAEIETPPPNNGEDDQTLFDKFRKPDDAIKKKSRASVSKEDLASIEKQMLPAKEFIDQNRESMVLTYQELSDFLESVQGSSDPLSVSKQYTIDTQALIRMMTEVYPYFTERRIKARCTKLKKRLTKQLLTIQNPPLAAPSDTDSDISSQDTF